MLNEALAVVPERGTITLTTDEARGSGNKVLELRFDGSLTGSEVPLREPDLFLRGCVVVDDDLVGPAFYQNQLAVVRVQVFSETATIDSDFVRRDINGDLSVDLSDCVYLLQYLFVGGSPPSCFDAGEANDDGKLYGRIKNHVGHSKLQPKPHNHLWRAKPLQVSRGYGETHEREP